MNIAERILRDSKGELNKAFQLAERLSNTVDQDYDNDTTVYTFIDRSILVLTNDKVRAR